MFPRSIKVIFCGILVAAFLLPSFQGLADENLEEICQWEKIKDRPVGLSDNDYKSLLRKCQEYYQARSEEIAGDITKTKKQKSTLQNKIYILKNKIRGLNYQIYQGNIMIRDLTAQIQDAETSINETSLRIKKVKENLVNILQLRYEEDQHSPIEVFLTGKTLSDFFDNRMALEALNLKTQDFLKDIKDLKTNLENQRESMDKEKAYTERVVTIQNLQKQQSARTKKEQEYFLRMTEAEYQKYLKEKKQAEETAAKIGNLLFELLEVPKGGIKFEDAVKIAKTVSQQVGIRAAFSLGVLWQETKIGKLKGGCYLRNLKTGDGIYIKSGNKAPRTMKPTPRKYEKFSDVYYFKKIVEDLNKSEKLKTDMFNSPVSCCMVTKNGFFGWGGAMGPAQFIPNTWMIYKEKIEKKTGDAPANPWSVKDSFLANALYLKDLGAGAQTYSKEMHAALRYFGCTSSWCKQHYGKPVMQVAGCIQDYIDKNSMSDSCKELVF